MITLSALAPAHPLSSLPLIPCCLPHVLAPQAYLASDSEGVSEEEGGPAGEEDEQAIRERYRRLLLGGGEAEERHGRKDWGADDDAGEECGSEEEGSEGEEQLRGKQERSGGSANVADDKGARAGWRPACPAAVHRHTGFPNQRCRVGAIARSDMSMGVPPCTSCQQP